MILQFSDGKFQEPIATSLKMWKNTHSFIEIKAFSVTCEKLNEKFPSMPNPPPHTHNFFHTFFFSPPTQRRVARSLSELNYLTKRMASASDGTFIHSLAYTECKYGGSLGRRPGRTT